jgi:hypothetical protein
MVPLAVPEIDHGARVAFLSGKVYWHQTVFCFASLQHFIEDRITPVVYDDGTFCGECLDDARRIVPWLEVVSVEEIAARLDRLLPPSKFPCLRARRLEYPHLRKFTDIHVGATDWTLVHDSDMLYFRSPDAIRKWFDAPFPLYMQDIKTAYGYPLDFLSSLAGEQVPDRINVGLYGIYSPGIDWERMEHACRAQIDTFGPHYLQEQALTAMALSGAGAWALPRADYLVCPDFAEGRSPTAILHHYVSHSKRSYYQYGWKLAKKAILDARR